MAISKIVPQSVFRTVPNNRPQNAPHPILIASSHSLPSQRSPKIAPPNAPKQPNTTAATKLPTMGMGTPKIIPAIAPTIDPTTASIAPFFDPPSLFTPRELAANSRISPTPATISTPIQMGKETCGEESGSTK